MGESTPSQTAWALLALFAAGRTAAPPSSAASPTSCGRSAPDGAWEDPCWNGTGFPRVFYLKYHLYAHYFPLWALGIYRRACMTERPLSPALRPFDAARRLGRSTSSISLGRFGTFFGRRWPTIVTPPFKFRAFVDRIDYIGFRSLLIILLTGAFTGHGARAADLLHARPASAPRRSSARRWRSRSSGSWGRCWRP